METKSFKNMLRRSACRRVICFSEALAVVDQCLCLCKVKLAINSDQTILYVTNEHTPESHAKELDILRYFCV